ncbi:MAG: phosphohistidine phosphatase SixA [Desulfobacterales bacterium]|jgi:phosphohistidine phosphatase
MALYLVQHGKSLPKDIDPEQGISETGRAEVERIAAVAANYGVQIAGIAHSGKKRALQTAAIFAAAFGLKDKVVERSGLKPLDDVVRLSAELRSQDGLMLVGHLPFMEKLTSYLVTGNVDKTIFKFQNGGIVCLEEDVAQNAWFIKWTLMPHID